jgi:hypothetical protein
MDGVTVPCPVWNRTGNYAGILRDYAASGLKIGDYVPQNSRGHGRSGLSFDPVSRPGPVVVRP